MCGVFHHVKQRIPEIMTDGMGGEHRNRRGCCRRRSCPVHGRHQRANRTRDVRGAGKPDKSGQRADKSGQYPCRLHAQMSRNVRFCPGNVRGLSDFVLPERGMAGRGWRRDKNFSWRILMHFGAFVSGDRAWSGTSRAGGVGRHGTMIGTGRQAWQGASGINIKVGCVGG